jgi:hypothetical protein
VGVTSAHGKGYGVKGRSGRRSVMSTHRFAKEIEVLLCAGWAPQSINQRLRILFPDYTPVSERVMERWRRVKLSDRLRPLVKFERELRDEHVLLDTVRGRAALIMLQRERVQRAVDFEQTMGGMVLQATRQEIETLGKLLEQYENALEMTGWVGRSSVAIQVMPPGQPPVDVESVIREQLEQMPEEARALMVQALEAARKARLRERVKEAEAKIAASLPAPAPKDASEIPVVEVVAG